MYCRSELSRSRRPVLDGTSIVLCAVATLAVFSAPVSAQQFDYDPEGYWKMPSPPATKGEFNGEDPIGLASRQHIPTDCAINWKDEAGKTFCFASAMSSQIFQEEKMKLLPKATAFWTTEHPRKPGPAKNSRD